MKKHPYSDSLRQRFVLHSAAYMLAAFLIISAVSILPYYYHLKSVQEEYFLNISRNKAQAVEQYLSRLAEVSRQISGRTTLRRYLVDYNAGQGDKARLAELTALWLKDSLVSPEVVGVTRLDATGQTMARAGFLISPEFWEVPGTDDRVPQFSEPLEIQDRVYLVVGSPILDENQSRIGTDIVLFSTDKLEALLWNCHRGARRICGDCLIAIETKDGPHYLFSTLHPDQKIVSSDHPATPYSLGAQQLQSGKQGLVGFKGQGAWPDTLVGVAPVAATSWGVVTLVAEKHLYAQITKKMIPLGVSILALTLISGIVMYGMLQPFGRRVLYFSTELEKLNSDLQIEIGERRQSEEHLRQSEREWVETFEAITDAVAIVDTKGDVLRSNQAAAAFLGTDPNNYEGRKDGRLFGFEGNVETVLFERMLQSGKPQFDDIYLPENDLFFHLSIYPLKRSDGSIWGSVHVAKDISDRKKIERLKDEFLSTVSHEMRTPLTAMLGFIEYMIEHEVDRNQQVEFLRTVQGETERLNELISNFLDMKQMEAELESYSFAPVEIRPLLEGSRRVFHLASKKHQVEVDCALNLPAVHGDEKRLVQVYKNLLSNAIKYSPGGGNIVLGAKREGESVVLWVSDQGLGIPQEDLEKVFGRFYRINSSAHRTPRGVGIGLALVREIVKAHHGTIWAESVLGRGSTFYVKLPIIASTSSVGLSSGMAGSRPSAG